MLFSHWRNVKIKRKVGSFSFSLAVHCRLAMSVWLLFSVVTSYEMEIIHLVCTHFVSVISQFGVNMITFGKKFNPKCSSGHVEDSFDSLAEFVFSMSKNYSLQVEKN